MAAQVKWTITSVTPTTGINAQGTPAKGQNVTYQLENGDSGTLFVPDAQYNPANVKQLVHEHAANTVAIKSLTGTVGV